MEIYVDDEAKLTLHGLVQVEFVDSFFYLFDYLSLFSFPLIDAEVFFCLLALLSLPPFSALHQIEGGREEP